MRKYGRVQTRFRVNYKKGMTAKVKKTIINLMIPSVDKGIVGGFYIMFFIGGVGQGSKILDISKILTCKFCGSQAGCQIVMTYYYFSFFFIPLFKWNRRFLIKMPCCGAVYELNAEVGKALARGEQAEIRNEDLKLLQEGNGRWTGSGQTGAQFREADGDEEIPETRRCPLCKYEAPGEFKYCPNCGQRLR